jgi:hypothetical protein
MLFVLVHRSIGGFYSISQFISFAFISILGATVVGMDTVGRPLAMAIRTRENTNLINAMVVVSIDGTTAAYMTACLVKTSGMARASLPGPMAPCTMENSSMANEKAMDNIPLVMGVNTMDLGRMDDMMDLERVRGKMDDAIKENGGMAWPMDEGRKRIRMGIFDMRDSGLMMNQFGRIVGSVSRSMHLCMYVCMYMLSWYGVQYSVVNNKPDSVIMEYSYIMSMFWK